jgi:S-adenosylmethionine hydrolase
VVFPARDLLSVIYIDHYGNAMTGVRAASISKAQRLALGRRALPHAPVFASAKGPFWYENSMGLVEIAAPRASAAASLGLEIGSPVRIPR